MDYVSVGEAARRIGRGAKPQDITMAFYRGAIDADGCIMAGGRRLIPADRVQSIEWALERAGKLLPRRREVPRAR